MLLYLKRENNCVEKTKETNTALNNAFETSNNHDVCSLFFYCKKRLEYFDLLNHRTSTFVLKTVSSTD